MRFSIAALSILCLAPPSLMASRPNRWTVSTPQEFLEGELKGVSLTSDGRLIPAPQLNEILDTNQAFIHSAALDRGGSVFVGTGSEGKIFRIGLDGTTEEWVTLSEGGVHALAVDSLNRLYAATAPDGKVYRIDRKGSSEVFFRPTEKYIWSLAIDRSNHLYVGTGSKGIVYRVDPQGQSTVLFDSKDIHVVALTVEPDGGLLAGTAPEGLLMRIDTAGSAFVLLDSDLDEIRSIAVDRVGAVYAAALTALSPKNDNQETLPSALPNPKENDSAEERSVAVPEQPNDAQSAIYRIDRDNLVETIHSSSTDLVFSLVVRNDGTVLAGTGNQGRILAIDGRRFVTHLVQTREEQVTQLILQEDTLVAATSNLGKIFQLAPQERSSGVYQSKVFDAQVRSRWGKIRWNVEGEGSQSVEITTRSGNTASPDETWSGWSAPYTESDNSDIQSPSTRYLQWQVRFPESTKTSIVPKSDALDRVSVTYLQHNVMPKIESITVHPPGMAFLPVPTNPSGGLQPGGPGGSHLQSLPRYIRNIGNNAPTPPPRRIYNPGAQSFSWRARDPNDDDLTYTMYIRRLETNSWQVLKEGLKQRYFSMDSASMPDGEYVLRVVVSDRSSNPPHQALRNEMVSKSFMISNEAPLVSVQGVSEASPSVQIEFSANTKVADIFQAEYSIDGGSWQIVFPKDGIADSRQEEFDLELTDLAPGEHTISIRVVDSIGQLGTGKATISIP